MNNLNKIIAILVLGLLTTMSISCSGDDDNWSPGPQPASDNPGVYFSQDIPMLIEFEVNQQLELIQDYYVLSLSRDKSKTASALQVPVKIRHADKNLSVPEFVNFEAGSANAELKIFIDQYELGTKYNLSIEIDENYANPYNASEDAGSSRIDAKVEVVCLIATATFTPTDYSGTDQPEFMPFEQKIYDNRDGTYLIKNFLLNGANYNLKFSLDEDKNIVPSLDYGYHDVAENRWYFYSANSSASANRIPCYIPGQNQEDYITYIYFYTAENSASYQDFWLDLDAKKGRMMGYSRYSVSSSGRIAFNITW